MRRLSGPMLTVSWKWTTSLGVYRFVQARAARPPNVLYHRSVYTRNPVACVSTYVSTQQRNRPFLSFFFFRIQSSCSHLSKIHFSFAIHEKLDRGRDENRFIPEHALVVLFYGDKSLLTPIGKRFFDRALSVSRGEKTERYRELRRLK